MLNHLEKKPHFRYDRTMYANVIVDISIEKLDKTFQYRIPEELTGEIDVGMQVEIPFGNRTITGFVVELTDRPEFDVAKIKPLIGVVKGSVSMEAQMIALAAWMRKNYGSTMNQALKTVLPIKRQTKAIEHRMVRLAVDRNEARKQLALFESKHNVAKARLLRELILEEEIDYSIVTQKLHVSAAVLRGLAQKKLIEVETYTTYRNPVGHLKSKGYHLTLNEGQQAAVEQVMKDRAVGVYATYLLKGVTGSGKTEVYMELIAKVIAEGKQAIVLIPEIALTYQTVIRFYNRFGNRVSILNSRLSAGERYDQYERAKNGDIDIMIGPRSALFTPFSNLGLIIMDEEHEPSYKSENAPRYHAREVAIERARMSKASVVLGSATPSVESYYQAKLGNYKLIELKSRAKQQRLARCEVVDLREELQKGNRSILSERLFELMQDRLQKKQQIMLFINRRGVAGFVSCRACGHVIKCPHCDVSLSLHNNGKMVCHYCGYEEAVPSVCPSCGSKYISGFKAGTQKVEQMVQKAFPDARILRMDFDTTRTKDSYETILQAFGNQEADILIGTQMIVKGHDFANVTLVGILAADMSLHVSDYHAAERTFALLTQAAGRAGRGDLEGNVVIQTYNPDHYAILTAKEQDYESFYEQEIEYRQMLHYPPAWNMLVVMMTGEREELLEKESIRLSKSVQEMIAQDHSADPDIASIHENGGMRRKSQIALIGPADAQISKMNDIYRRVIYLKSADYNRLIEIKDQIEALVNQGSISNEVNIQFDFNPMSGF